MNWMNIAVERGLGQRLKLALAKLEVEHGGRKLAIRAAVERLIEVELASADPFSFLVEDVTNVTSEVPHANS